MMERDTTAINWSWCQFKMVQVCWINLQIVRFVFRSKVRQYGVLMLIAVVQAAIGQGCIVERNPDSQGCVEVIRTEVEIVLMDGFGTACFRGFHENLTEKHVAWGTHDLLNQIA